MIDTVCPNCGASCAIAQAQADSAGVAPQNRPIVYEIHVTVTNARVPEFQAACETIGVKPVLLELQRGNSDSLFDLMTSSSVKVPDLDVAFRESQRIVDALEDKEFHVIRIKIETVPWHPAARETLKPYQYFETHFPMRYRLVSDLTPINEVVMQFGLHVSRNVFKKNEDGSQILMATYRTSEDVDTFIRQTDDITELLHAKGVVVEKIISEFAIYDTKLSHDAEWVQQSEPRPPIEDVNSMDEADFDGACET